MSNQTWTYFVTYDLRAPGRDYNRLFAAIQALAEDWIHPLESVWIVRAPLSQLSIRNRLLSHVDQNDVLLVYELKPTEWASLNLGQRYTNWLSSNAAA